MVFGNREYEWIARDKESGEPFIQVRGPAESNVEALFSQGDHLLRGSLRFGLDF